MDAVQKCSLLLLMSHGLSLCVFVGHSREPCRTAEPIEMPFGLWTLVGSEMARKREILEGHVPPLYKIWGVYGEL